MAVVTEYDDQRRGAAPAAAGEQQVSALRECCRTRCKKEKESQLEGEPWSVGTLGVGV
jgi:hypothetical protein